MSPVDDEIHEPRASILLTPASDRDPINKTRWRTNNEVCGIIKPGRRVELNRSQAVNVHKLLTIHYFPTAWL